MAKLVLCIAVAAAAVQHSAATLTLWRCNLLLVRVVVVKCRLLSNHIGIWITSSLSFQAFNIFGDRCFAAAGPRLRNSLPINLRQCHSLEQGKRLLKTFLFSAWSHGALWHLPESAPYINPLTYLLTYLLTNLFGTQCRKQNASPPR